ncbi:MAG: cation:proton antiporter [Candidatus Bathyarchaeia archaeon]
MAVSVSIALVIAAIIILIGFLANYLFKKTGLPDMLILIFLGALFGPMLGVFDIDVIKSFAPYIAALALAYILFDGGMGLNLRQVFKNSPKAFLLAALSFTFSVLGVAAFMIAVFNVPLTYGLLFGTIVGGSSSVVVISLANRIKISDKGSTILILESALTDILCIVISLALIEVIVTGQANVASIGFGVATKFLIGILIGVTTGFAWLFALRRLADLDFSYILTLGIILLGYALSESIGGSGALSALIFGLILGNEKDILHSLTNVFKFNIGGSIDGKIELSVSKGLKRFESEIAFLIRTFFFVFLGIIASISSVTLLFAGIIVALILFVTRYGAVFIATANSPMKKERQIMTYILTRGLAAAVLATLPAQYSLLYADLFINIAVVVIVTTAIIATVGSIVVSHPDKIQNIFHLKLKQKPEEEPLKPIAQ